MFLFGKMTLPKTVYRSIAYLIFSVVSLL